MRGRHDSVHDLVRYVRQYRESAGLTQQRLAALAGMSLGALRDLEQGRTTQPAQRTLDQLAAVLGLGSGERNHLLAAQPEQATGAGGDPASRSATGSGLRLGILGPLAVWRDGSPVALGGTRQRAVLGALALHRVGGLHRDAIADLLWGEDPPPSAVAIVHSQISQLRRLLEPGRAARADRILVSEGAQYWLHPRVLSDAGEFAARVEQAEAVTSAGDLASACAAYATALDLWRGEVLADVEVLRAHPAAVELGWRWASVITAYAEVALTAGCADRVIRHLRGLAVREPLNEKAHALLLRSLTATGQRAAALDLFERTRRRLADELGASPGPDLAEAHLQALRETDPATPGASGSAAAAGGGGDRPGRGTPLQLPPVTPYFAGRSAELGALTAMTDQGTQARGAVVTIAIVGQTQFRLGLAEAADVHQHEALELGRQLDSGIIQGRALLELARIADHQGRRRDAVTHAERSLPHFQAAESPSWAADALNAAAWYRSQLGDHLMALAYCERALDTQRDLGNQIGEAATLDSLGYIHHQLGHYDRAIACFQEAVEVQGDTLIAGERAMVLVHLGDACHAAGEAAQAGPAWRQALSILEDMGDPGADAVRRKLQDAGLPSDPGPSDPGAREVREARLEGA